MDEAFKNKWTNRDSVNHRKFPFNSTKSLENFDLSAIHSYVQNIISQNLDGNSKLSAEVFETHQSVIAKIKIPKQLNPRSLRIWVSANHIKLEATQDNKEQIIPLPCKVNGEARKAVYKQGILEIRMPKLKARDRYHEVFVQY